MTHRKTYVDVLKGLCICLIIIGHCSIPSIGLRLIYLFHVPMFFFLSGYFFKDRPLFEEGKRAGRALLWPYLLGVLSVGLKYGVDYFRGADIFYLKKLVIAALVVGPKVDIMGYLDLQIGVIWFLASLFFCRILFQATYLIYSRIVSKGKNVYSDLLFCVVIVVFSFGATLFLKDGKSILGLGQAVVALFFYASGVIFQKAKTIPFLIQYGYMAYLGGFAFVSVFFRESLNLYSFDFPAWWSIWASLLAIIFLVKCSQKISTYNNVFIKFFSALGRYSILLMLVHYFEFMTFDWGKLGLAGGYLSLIRITIDILVSAFLLKLPITRKLLHLETDAPYEKK